MILLVGEGVNVIVVRRKITVHKLTITQCVAIRLWDFHGDVVAQLA